MNVTATAKNLVKQASNLVHNLRDDNSIAAERDLRDSFEQSAKVIPTKDWTVLVYAEGTHRLAHSTDLAINKMEQLGSSDKVNIVVQATQSPTWQERLLPHMSDVPTRRYYITQDQKADEITSPVLGQFDKAIPLSGQSLQDFVEWGMKNFPSKHVMLVVKKHGAGFASVTRQKKNGEIDSPVALSARELSEALANVQAKTGKKIDVLDFDSCSMQQMEVAYQVKDQVNAMVGSQEDVLAVVHPYANSLVALNQLDSNAGAEDAAVAMVATYSQRVERGMQSAVRSEELAHVAGSVKSLVNEIISQKVDSSLLYTTMQSTPSSEPTQTSSLSYNFRDLGRFFEGVVSDQRYPESVREKAEEALQAYSDSIIARYASADKQVIKKPSGLSCFLPWKGMPEGLKENYQQLDWAKDSGWGELLDYALEVPAQVETKDSSAQEDLSSTQRIGKWGLLQYKKYISPFLTTSCAYTPSCSQFAREALQSYGFKEGSKLGFLRFVSCDGHLRGADPVHKGECSDHDHNHEEASQLPLISAPTVRHTSEQSSKHAAKAAMAGKLGRVLGGVVGAVVAAPVGAVIGSVLGYRTGRHTHENRVEQLKEQYSPSIAHGYSNLSKNMDPLTKVTDKIGHGVAAGVVGSSLGILGGAAGGAMQGMKWGKLFGTLWAQNRVKDHYGELPQNPANQLILQRDYHK